MGSFGRFLDFWNTLKLKSQPEKTSTSDHQERFVHLAQHMSPEVEESEIEAPYLFKNEDYYYLFVNWGGCCNGTKSTYNVRMGRSKNILGPYLDRKQKDMRDGGGNCSWRGMDGTLVQGM